MSRYNAHHARFIISASILCPLCVLAVYLRFLARMRTKAHYGADDWLAVLSLVLFFAFTAARLWCSQNGSGYDPATLPLPVLVAYLKGVYIVSVFPPAALTAAKFSILCLYNRAFSSHKGFRLAVKIVGFLNALWFVAATVGLCLKCVPIEKSWNPLLPGRCINFRVFLVAIESPNSFLDFVMVALPLGVLRELQLPLKHKITLGFIFALGSFVGVIGFIRIAIIYVSPSNLSDLGHWVFIQLAFGVICCCLPTYRPLLPKENFLASFKSRYLSFLAKRYTPAASRSGNIGFSDSYATKKGMRFNGYDNIKDRGVQVQILARASTESIEGDRYIAGMDFPIDSINVRSTVDVV